MKIKDYIDKLQPGKSFEPIDCLELTKSPVEVCEDFTFLMDNIENGRIKRLLSGTLIKSLDPDDYIVRSSREDDGDKYPLEDFINGVIDKIGVGSFFSQEDISRCYLLPTCRSRKDDIFESLKTYIKAGVIRRVNYSNEYLFEKVSNNDLYHNELQRLFIDFLIDNKCYREFNDEIGKSNKLYGTSVCLCIDNLLNGKIGDKAVKPFDWISKSFFWSNSKGGSLVWRERNIKWLKKLALFVNPDINGLLESIETHNHIIDEYAYVNEVTKDVFSKSEWSKKWYLFNKL